jgi:hypothetical protein
MFSANAGRARFAPGRETAFLTTRGRLSPERRASRERIGAAKG